jgi:hypothetical protein
MAAELPPVLRFAALPVVLELAFAALLALSVKPQGHFAKV